MKIEDLEKNIKEKMIFEGKSGTGKTNLCLKITKIYAMNKKRVLYIDPQHGTDRDSKKIFGDLSANELENIELIHATNIDTYIKYMYGWTEDKSIGPQKNIVQYGLNYDLKICDGLGSEIELYKAKLSRDFQNQGFYEISGRRFDITNKSTWVLPYQFYGKLYDQIKEAIIIMLDHKYDLITTLHPLKQTDAQQALQESFYGEFDSVVRLNKLLLPNGNPMWNATIVKNRGRESPDKSNTMESVDPLILYFMNKFSMPIDETIDKLR